MGALRCDRQRNGDRQYPQQRKASDADCAERLELLVSEYERVRGDSLCFVVAKGHEFPDFEQVVEEAEGYDVVRKQEKEAAEVAEETDPRS